MIQRILGSIRPALGLLILAMAYPPATRAGETAEPESATIATASQQPSDEIDRTEPRRASRAVAVASQKTIPRSTTTPDAVTTPAVMAVPAKPLDASELKPAIEAWIDAFDSDLVQFSKHCVEYKNDRTPARFSELRDEFEKLFEPYGVRDLGKVSTRRSMLEFVSDRRLTMMCLGEGVISLRPMDQMENRLDVPITELYQAAPAAKPGLVELKFNYSYMYRYTTSSSKHGVIFTMKRGDDGFEIQSIDYIGNMIWDENFERRF